MECALLYVQALVVVIAADFRCRSLRSGSDCAADAVPSASERRVISAGGDCLFDCFDVRTRHWSGVKSE